MLHSRRAKRKRAGVNNRRRDKNYAAGGIIAILPAAFFAPTGAGLVGLWTAIENIR